MMKNGIAESLPHHSLCLIMLLMWWALYVHCTPSSDRTNGHFLFLIYSHFKRVSTCLGLTNNRKFNPEPASRHLYTNIIDIVPYPLIPPTFKLTLESQLLSYGATIVDPLLPTSSGCLVGSQSQITSRIIWYAVSSRGKRRAVAACHWNVWIICDVPRFLVRFHGGGSWGESRATEMIRGWPRRTWRFSFRDSSFYDSWSFSMNLLARIIRYRLGGGVFQNLPLRIQEVDHLFKSG